MKGGHAECPLSEEPPESTSASTDVIVTFGVVKVAVAALNIPCATTRESLLGDGSEFIVSAAVGVVPSPASAQLRASTHGCAPARQHIARTPRVVQETAPFTAAVGKFSDTHHALFLPLVVTCAAVDDTTSTAESPKAIRHEQLAVQLSPMQLIISVRHRNAATEADALIYQQAVALLPLLRLGAQGMVASLQLESLAASSPSSTASGSPLHTASAAAPPPAALNAVTPMLGAVLDLVLEFHDLRQCVAFALHDTTYCHSPGDSVGGGAAALPLPRRCDFLPHAGTTTEGTPPLYGAVPLDAVYRTCAMFFQERALMGPIRACRQVAQYLSAAQHRWRWEMLIEMDLRLVILGDNGLLPLLATMQLCRGLQRFACDKNSLSLVSARRLFDAFRHHPSLCCLSCRDNAFFELAGEELLRLLRVNRRILFCDVRETPISSHLHARIARVQAANRAADDDDPFNFTSPQFDYLTDEGCIPDLAWKSVVMTWAMLTSRSMISDDEDGENNGGGVGGPSNSIGERIEEATGTSRLDPTVPLAVTAPLFALVMRTLQVGMEKVYQDPVIRNIFAEIGSAIAASEVAKGEVYPVSFAKLIAMPMRIFIGFPHRFGDAARALQGLGRHHAALGVTAAHYRTASRLWVEALTAHIGPDIMGPEVRAAWTQVLALFVRLALTG